MTLDEILKSLFPAGHEVTTRDGVVLGNGTIGALETQVIGVADRTPLGVEHAARLAARVLEILRDGGDGPILVLIDSDSQRMSKRDEMLGLSEYLAHLAKCLMAADLAGRHTIGLLYGHTAAGAFIATALATRTLVALPGAEPEVMDLPSMARVTKLSLDVLREMARSTPVFAPGLENLATTGAVALTWDPEASLATQLQALLEASPASGAAGSASGAKRLGQPTLDTRDQLGRARGGRPKAADIAQRVYDLAR
jgi:malonate decarboxylase gamma subunit